MSTSPKAKTINDPVHGHYWLSPTLVSIIDTPHFQRLRDLKQLGASYFVFPGASHNRFEHCLGVSHLSGKFFDKLCTSTAASLVNEWPDFNERAMRRCRSLLEVAGAVHDLGHGPFSHLFDRGFLRRCGTDKTNPLIHHENRSRMLFEHLVDRFHIDLDREEVICIGDLITQDCGGNKDDSQLRSSSLCPSFAFNIVSNKQSGLDTDKFDYLARDIKNLGMSFGFDHNRLMHYSKAINGNISFHKKELYNVYDLFLTRFKLHRLVCAHRTTCAVDGMINDAFIAADPVLKMSDAINDPDEFLKLSDAVLKVIEFSTDPGLARARHLIERLRRRHLYRFVHEVIVPDSHADLELSEVDITTCQEGGGYNLKPEDIYVRKSVCNLGMKGENPVEHVHFHADDQAWNAGVEEVIPRKFEERLIRVYTRCEEKDVEQVRKEAGKAFRNCLKRLGLVENYNETNGAAA